MDLCLVDKVDAFHVPGSYSCRGSSWERRFPTCQAIFREAEQTLLSVEVKTLIFAHKVFEF